MHRGWIKLYRKIEEWRYHPYNCDEKFSKYEAFIDMIMMANHADRMVEYKKHKTLVKRGQFITSLIRLQKRWKWPKSTIHDFLKDLERHGEIRMQNEHYYTIVTICNYDAYQGNEHLHSDESRTPFGQSSDSNRTKQELKELEELDNCTTTEDFVKFYVEKSVKRFRSFNISVEPAINDITAYAITNHVPKSGIGPLVFRWPENSKKKINQKLKKKEKDYGKPGITKV